MTKEQKYALDISQAVFELFGNDDGEKKLELQKIDPTAFFTGFVIAFNLVYGRLTQEDEDLIGALAVQNRLVFQYLLKDGKAK